MNAIRIYLHQGRFSEEHTKIRVRRSGFWAEIEGLSSVMGGSIKPERTIIDIEIFDRHIAIESKPPRG